MQASLIIESFWQRGANCGCIAYIKALLLRYGIKAGMKIQEKRKEIVVHLPGATSIQFTRKEIVEINKHNEISFRQYKTKQNKVKSKKIKFIVHLLFAVLVRNAKSFHRWPEKAGNKKAIAILTKKGVDTRRFHRYLQSNKGRVHRFTARSLGRLKEKKSVLLYNQRHITVLSKGYYDNMGHAELMLNQVPLLLGEKATHWFEIK